MYWCSNCFQFESRCSFLPAIDETEFQVNDRRSFVEYVYLDIIIAILIPLLLLLLEKDFLMR
jgi:hypothetical protein